ncbi:serine O-acetyltransferase [Aquimarina sediminis]|uniref:serine O-acetyltransferase n=1 Tax=Aquimarina sediminis TaxID=2070536 RepID=UPI000CA08A5F|nr:serine acetyltransferase [Aquimarina sediminis]
MVSILITLYKIFLIPHLVVYRFSKNRAKIDMDIDRWAAVKGMKMGKYVLLLDFLANSRDFRTIFYFRTRSLVSHALNIYCRKQSNFTIDISTKLGGGIVTGHPYCTILNADAIGDNFYVNHLVTIGEEKGKRPTIGNNVSIYTGAIVIGDITIGDNCIIGAGSVVTKSIPDNCTAVGNPARILTKKINREMKYKKD